MADRRCDHHLCHLTGSNHEYLNALIHRPSALHINYKAILLIFMRNHQMAPLADTLRLRHWTGWCV